MSLALEKANEVFANQPFSQLIGANLTHFDTIAEITLPMRDQLKQQNGFAHGGVISYLADNALTFAGGLALGEMVLTSEYKINYLKPRHGNTLIARAEVISSTKRQAVCKCDVFVLHAGKETLCATALGTIVSFGK